MISRARLAFWMAAHDASVYVHVRLNRWAWRSPITEAWFKHVCLTCVEQMVDAHIANGGSL